MDSLFVALRPVQDNSFQSTQLWSMIIALAAVIVGPFVSFFIAKRTIQTQLLIAEQSVKADVLSSNRQDWINRLRDNVSEYLGMVVFLADKDIPTDKFEDLIGKCFVTRARILLMLNPDKPDHVLLSDLLGDLAEFARKPFDIVNGRTWAEARQNTIDVTRRILKREWENVKAVR